VVTRRGRGEAVCARGAWLALLGGPSTSSLDGVLPMLTATALGLRFASAAAVTSLIVSVCINVLLPPHTISFNQLSSWLIELIGFFAWAWFAFSLGAHLVQREFASTNRLPIFIGAGYALTVPALANLPVGENIAGVCIILITFVAGCSAAFWLRGTPSNNRSRGP